MSLRLFCFKAIHFLSRSVTQSEILCVCSANLPMLDTSDYEPHPSESLDFSEIISFYCIIKDIHK